MIARAWLIVAVSAAIRLGAQDHVPGTAGYTVAAGTRVPLTLINSVSTKHSVAGDRLYLQTVFPILVNSRIVIPPGSYVAGTVTDVKRPGRVKGRGELWVRFDSLTLPNGVTRDFRARVGGVDGLSNEELDKSEGKVKAEGNIAGDARTIGEAAAAGASVGVIAGAATNHYGMGTAIGAGAGAAAGMIGVLLSRGPDAVLAKGSTIEMVLDREVDFNEADLNFGNYQPPPPPAETPSTAPAKNGSSIPTRVGRFPF
jgi:type IV secretion system protein VirB10